MAVVVSDEEKAPVKALGGDREGERKRIVADVSKAQQMTSKPGCRKSPGMSLAGGPLIGQAVSGMETTRARSAASTWNRRRRAPILPACWWWARGSVSKRGDREGREYRRGGALADRFVVAMKVL
jgi:hypothetical protein